jgi:hypothetical protein
MPLHLFNFYRLQERMFMKGIIAVLLVGLVAVFVTRAIRKGNQPITTSRQREETMSKSDDLLLNDLSYASNKESQAATEGFNIFYMYILIVTIIGAAVSQIVADHITAKTSNPPLELTSLALDGLACVLLAAAFVFSCICFKAYFDTAKRQLASLVEREKVKSEYNKGGYLPAGTTIEAQTAKIKEKEARQLVPDYIRYITILAGSLCLGGCFAIGSAAIAFHITPYNLHVWDWHYYLILGIVAVIGIVLIITKMSTIKRKYPEANLLKYGYSFLPFGAYLVLSFFAPQVPFASSNVDCSQMPVTNTVTKACNEAALPAFEIYVLAGLIGGAIFIITCLAFMRYTYKRIEDLSKPKVAP